MVDSEAFRERVGWVALLGGFALLVVGGGVLVRGATEIAKRLGVSTLLIGITVVGFGTSTPELLTSLQAAFAGSPGIAIGNIVGSNTANILLILGLSAVMMPFAVDRRGFMRDGPVVVIAALACVGVVLTGGLSRAAGLALVLGLTLYLVYAYRTERQAYIAGLEQDATVGSTDAERPVMVLPLALVWAIGGIAITVFGAHLLVTASLELAGLWGVSDSIIGLTIVAVGTSLPELITSVVAAFKREGGIAFGNVLGSNIYNVLGILGVTALVLPIPVPEQIASVDVWVMLAATVALVAVTVTGWRINRAKGMLLMFGYAGYIAWLVVGN